MLHATRPEKEEVLSTIERILDSLPAPLLMKEEGSSLWLFV